MIKASEHNVVGVRIYDEKILIYTEKYGHWIKNILNDFDIDYDDSKSNEYIIVDNKDTHKALLNISYYFDVLLN